MSTVKSVVDGQTIRPFFSNRFPFSNFYRTQFTVDGNKFYSSEQYFMYLKALQFSDNESAQKLLSERDPPKCKAIGRSVKNFDESVWNRESYEAMVKAIRAKFSQNQDLKEYLLATGTAILVEASPYDRIWGIGMAESDENINNPNKWNGQNLLGKALMQVRDE
ncbi:DUF1768 domain-containing protein [Aphelenchoides bicaudatus]|nr:DUF1768 domain-containing protein [Aphelenchoides bicaudatus]